MPRRQALWKTIPRETPTTANCEPEDFVGVDGVIHLLRRENSVRNMGREDGRPKFF
jgi:hypothetical protein